MSLELSELVIAAIKKHALREFPRESCGFVTEAGYVEVENISPTPEETFEVSAENALLYENALCFMHSHPVVGAYNHNVYKPGFYPFCPSHADMVSQISTGFPWGIVVTDGQEVMPPFFWGDFAYDLPIYDRPFRHGVEDCWTLAQKWFWQEKGVRLANIPRSDHWWTTQEDLYMANYTNGGFYRISSDETLQAGDCGLIQIGGKNVKSLNHIFVYLGDGTVAHHLPGRKSCREAMGGRLKDVQFWMRHKSVCPMKVEAEGARS